MENISGGAGVPPATIGGPEARPTNGSPCPRNG
jgi:hypothetical protein